MSADPCPALTRGVLCGCSVDWVSGFPASHLPPTEPCKGFAKVNEHNTTLKSIGFDFHFTYNGMSFLNS